MPYYSSLYGWSYGTAVWRMRVVLVVLSMMLEHECPSPMSYEKPLRQKYTPPYYLRAVELVSSPPAGVKSITKTANYCLVVEYMDRAQGPTMDFCAQNCWT